jgi:hypothetical protein
MQLAPQVRTASIVSVGHFNPLIFRPEWFKDKEILIGNDFKNVKIDVIHPDIVSFRTPWGQLQVDRERFSIATTQEPVIRAFDFFVKAFQFLPETPIRAVGLNHEFHFDAGNRAAFDRVGDTLAPKDFWGNFLLQKGERVGGMRTLIMEQAKSKDGQLQRLDGSPGYVRVRIEPSALVTPYGVFVQVNDHFDLFDGDKLSDGQRTSDLVVEKWEPIIATAEQIVDNIMGLANAS